MLQIEHLLLIYTLFLILTELPKNTRSIILALPYNLIEPLTDTELPSANLSNILTPPANLVLDLMETEDPNVVN